MLIRHAGDDHGLHLDFVPMVDVLFNLLIFFLLATSIHQAEREIHVALPSAASSGPISAALREIIITVDEGGGAFLNGKPVVDSQLADTVRDAVRANPEQKVSVRGDKATAYANVARILDVCKGAGVAEPYLDTVPLD